MIIPGGFDESNAERRKRIFDSNLKTAKKLNERMRHFKFQFDSNHSLTKTQKEQVEKELLKGFIK